MVEFDRVIEFFDPKDGTIRVDLFLANNEVAVSVIYVMHRGNLRCTDVTEESWGRVDDLSSTERDLADRIQILHAGDRNVIPPESGRPENDIIELSDQGVRLASHFYQLGPTRPERVAGTSEEHDVPFTMWKMSIVTGRRIVRLKMEMTSATYEVQIGRNGEFEAFGEALLLDKIECEDLPAYRYGDRRVFEEQFAFFGSSQVTHLVPRVFEYLLIGPRSTPLRYSAQCLSAVSEPIVYDEALSECTLWFLADIEKTREFSLSGQAINSFAVAVYAY